MLAQVKGNHLEIQQQQLLTQGSVGQKLALSLSEDWEGLAVTAVFSAGSTRCDVLVNGREIDIPWELFKEPDHKLFLNLHGGSTDGRIVLRTNIACLGNIEKSREPSGHEGEAPSPSLVDQIQAAASQALSLAQELREEADSGRLGPGGSSDYTELSNKPSINGTELSGAKTLEDIGAASEEELDDLREVFVNLTLQTTELQLNDFAQQHGYYQFFFPLWESGSINFPSGTNKNPDAKVIRTALPRIQPEDNLVITLLNTQYRLKVYEFPAADGVGDKQSNWYTAVGSYEYAIDPNKFYRIQIATNRASALDIQEVFHSILLSYASDKIVCHQERYDFDAYWKSYIEGKVNDINGCLADGRNKSAFLLLTDTHWHENKAYLNARGINTDLMRYVADLCNLDTCIHCGDLNSEHRSNKALARQFMTKPVSLLRSVFPNVFLTRGNHDDNLESGNNVWDYVITQSDAYSYMFRNTRGAVFGETGTYFYHDNPNEKLRVISLDCVDFPYENSVDATKSDLKILAYGHGQLQWLCDTLQSTPAGYHIVLVTHAMLTPSPVTRQHPEESPQTRALNDLTVCEILKAYKNRTAYSATMDGSFVPVHKDYYTGTLSADFSGAAGTLVGVFSGHEHIDCIEEILDANGNGIGIFNTCTQSSSTLFASSVVSSGYQHPMQNGSTSELVWDVVVIDRDLKTVSMIRIGAEGANTNVEAAAVRSFRYT